MNPMNRTTRRQVIQGAAAIALSGVGLRASDGTRRSSAQSATPGVGPDLAGLGLPEVAITVTDAGFQAPSQIPAGHVLLTVTNTGQQPTDVNLVLPPAGVALADIAALFGPPSATPAAAAATPGAEEAVPPWIYQATWAGGPIAPAGQTIQAVVELTPGDWILLNDSPGSPQAPQAMTVSGNAGATPAAMAMPAADVTVQLQEYAFLGLDRPLPTGPRLWQFTNTGQQPHFMLLTKGPAGITMDQVMTLVNLPDNAPPPPGFPYQESDFDFNQPGVAALSPGHTSWVALDLAPGTYVALCFVPDEKTGAPHAAMGMVAIFTVGEGSGTPQATPTT